MTKFDVGQVLDALSDFEYRVSEDPGFDTKLISIGETYGISGEDLADTIIAFAVRHHTTYVDQVLLQQLEQELAKKRAVKEKHEAAHKAKIIAPYRPPPESYKDGKDHEEFQDINTFSRKYREFAPVQNTMFHTDFLHREGINSEVTATTGQQYVDAKLTTEKIEVKLLSASPDHFFANDKAASVIEAKCDRMRSFSQLYFDANPQIGDWSRTLHPSESTIYVYGEVVREKTDLFHDGLLHIQLDNDVGTILPIDVSNLSKVTVFPGQIAAFGGIFTASEILEATEQLSLPKLAPMPITNPRSGMLKIVMAAGPFTNSEHLGFEPLLTLLDGIIDDAENAPNFLILHGPFVDRKNKSLFNKDLNVSATEVMDRLMANIGTKLTGIRTEVILQPSSTKDVSSLGSFPAPALNLEVKFGTKVHLVPDPAVIDVGGIRLALTSSEIVSHLSKAEFHKSDGTDAVDRITRLSNHLLDQRSLYPLSPSPIPIRLCDMLTVSKLDCAPHMLIVPSLLPPSVKVSDTTVVCNPGSLLRAKSGTYVEAHINLGKLGTEAAKFTEVSRFRVLRI